MQNRSRHHQLRLYRQRPRPRRRHTYWHHDGRKLIGLDWYELNEWNLVAAGTCRFCGTPYAGGFDAECAGSKYLCADWHASVRMLQKNTTTCTGR